MQKRKAHFDLVGMAYRVMQEHGFATELPANARHQLSDIEGNGRVTQSAATKDLRHLLWSSIDNDESLDLDQIEYAERTADGSYRLVVGIADVDRFVQPSTPLDGYAQGNATSVYTGVHTFPMLPEDLSTNLSSLKGNSNRQALIVDMIIDKTGSRQSADVYLAQVENKAKLAYDTVAAWLEKNVRFPLLDSVDGLEEQLRLQSAVADALISAEDKAGALGVQTLEANAVADNGVVIGLKLTQHNKARDLIQVLMVTANGAMAEFVQKRNVPSIVRVVKKPERWTRLIALARRYGYQLSQEPDARALAAFVADRKAKDPLHFPDLSLAVVKLLGPGEYVVQIPGEPTEGHFSLAVHDYTHATAPNRRYVDLIIQRVIKALLSDSAQPYTLEDLQQLAEHCMDREEQARKVERIMRKAAAAVLLAPHIGQTYQAIVTNANEKGTYVRLISPPAEGRIVINEKGVDVGDRVTVKLLKTDPYQGWIDFERINA